MQGVARVLALFLAPLALAAAASERAAEAPELAVIDGASKEGVEVLAGMLTAFLHRGQITPAEVHCMTASVKNVTHLAFQASTDVASALLSLASPDGTMAEALVATADLLLLLPKLQESLGKLLDLFGGFLGPCIGSSSRQALEAASRHMANLTYVSGHLQANGADIVRELADAVEAFNAGKIGHFGESMGKACRKVLLSNTSMARLPEGGPSVDAMVNLTAGLLEGFFGRGFEVDITSGKPRLSAPADDGFEGMGSYMVTDAEEPTQVDVRIDLHKCVKDNMGLIRPALMKTLEYLARQDLASEGDDGEVLPDLIATMTEDTPTTLGRCGIGEDEVEMLGAALASFGSMRVQLKLPHSAERAAMEGPVVELQKAADDWRKLDWFSLGKDFGRMLVQMVVQVYPQKYALGPAGAVGKRLAAPAAVAVPGLFGGVSLLLLGLVGARGWRVLAARCGREGRGDLERGAGSAAE